MGVSLTVNSSSLVRPVDQAGFQPNPEMAKSDGIGSHIHNMCSQNVLNIFGDGHVNASFGAGEAGVLTSSSSCNNGGPGQPL